MSQRHVTRHATPCMRAHAEETFQTNIYTLFDGLTYNTSRHFAHCSYFSSPLRGSEKYYATRKISARIIC